MRMFLAAAFLLAAAGPALADPLVFTTSHNETVTSVSVDPYTGAVIITHDEQQVLGVRPGLDLEPPFVLVVVDTTEPGAAVYVDGQRVL